MFETSAFLSMGFAEISISVCSAYYVKKSKLFPVCGFLLGKNGCTIQDGT